LTGIEKKAWIKKLHGKLLNLKGLQFTLLVAERNRFITNFHGKNGLKLDDLKSQCCNLKWKNAVREMENGLVDADLGGNILKKRIALPGRGKSGSARTLIATNRGSRWIFMFGFEKNERENITRAALAAARRLARDYLEFTEQTLLTVIASRQPQKVTHD
jgi:hypothetical protein